VWYNFKDGKLIAVSNQNGTKVQSLKKDPELDNPDPAHVD
jgi:hypothetical protein